MKNLRLYKTPAGKEPFVAWIESLKDGIAVAQTNTRVRRLALGRRGDCKRVGKEVYELRIHFGPGYRVYFAQQKQAVVVLLLGGDKGSQKSDIKQAIAYWQDYKERYRE